MRVRDYSACKRFWPLAFSRSTGNSAYLSGKLTNDSACRRLYYYYSLSLSLSPFLSIPCSNIRYYSEVILYYLLQLYTERDFPDFRAVMTLRVSSHSGNVNSLCEEQGTSINVGNFVSFQCVVPVSTNISITRRSVRLPFVSLFSPLKSHRRVFFFQMKLHMYIHAYSHDAMQC